MPKPGNSKAIRKVLLPKEELVPKALKKLRKLEATKLTRRKPGPDDDRNKARP